MDEISLNIARRHCRSPLSGGEMRGFKKSAMQEIPRLSRKGNVAHATKEKVQRQMLGRGSANGENPIRRPESVSNRLFCCLHRPRFGCLELVKSPLSSFRREG